MKIREAINENCGECGRFKKQLVSESYGCDGCKKPIDDLLANQDNKHRHYLEVSIFYEHSRETKHLQFCSWRCVLKTVPKLKTDYFITLPYLTFDNSLEKGIRAKDFFAAIRPQKWTGFKNPLETAQLVP